MTSAGGVSEAAVAAAARAPIRSVAPFIVSRRE
jgi:hypothetical protein